MGVVQVQPVLSVVLALCHCWQFILNRATMLSSRKVTGLVIKEMTAYHKNKAFSEVNCEDFIDFINNCHRQTLSKNICRIIYKTELDDSRTNLLNTWLLRKTPILSVCYFCCTLTLQINNYIRHIREF